MQEANDLHREVERPREQAVDSEVFALATESGAEYLRKLSLSARKHTPEDLLRRLRFKYAPSLEADVASLDWAALGRDAARCLRTCPRLLQLLGPLEAQPRPRAARAARRVVVGELVRPEEVSTQDMAGREAQETDQQLTDMWELVRGAPDGGYGGEEWPELGGV